MRATRTLWFWLHRLAASVPSAWHYDRLFRWMVIGAGISLVVFVCRPDPAARYPTASAPIAATPTRLGPPYGSSPAEAPLAPPVTLAAPKITPGRSLDSVTISPPPADDFGTVPPTNK